MAANYTSAADLASYCRDLPAIGYPIGVILGVIGSVGINIGQNLQASGLLRLDPSARTKPYKSRLWQFGLFIFIVFSLLNFGALALAPASVLTPLESIQFVTNIAWNRCVNKKVVSRRMMLGVLLALVGTVFSVVFGAQPSGCHSVAELQGFWVNALWWIYLVVTVGLAFLSFVYHAAGSPRKASTWARRKDNSGRVSMLRRSSLVLQAQVAKSVSPRLRDVLMPISYTLASALAGGAQMIVHSKAVSELLSMLFQGDINILKTWIFYVELLLVIVCGIIWSWRLTACLIIYDPLVILPLMVGTYILFGGIGGGLYFQEFRDLHTGWAGGWHWACYVVGMLLVLVGLGLIADTRDTQSGSVAAGNDRSRSVSPATSRHGECSVGGGAARTSGDSTGEPPCTPPKPLKPLATAAATATSKVMAFNEAGAPVDENGRALAWCNSPGSTDLIPDGLSESSARSLGLAGPLAAAPGASCPSTVLSMSMDARITAFASDASAAAAIGGRRPSTGQRSDGGRVRPPACECSQLTELSERERRYRRASRDRLELGATAAAMPTPATTVYATRKVNVLQKRIEGVARESGGVPTIDEGCPTSPNTNDVVQAIAAGVQPKPPG